MPGPKVNADMDQTDRPENRDDQHREPSSRLSRTLGLSSAGGTLATSLTVYAATLVAGMLLSRGLGPAGRGELAAVVLWGSLAFDIGALGTPHAVAYFAASAGPGRRNPGLVIMRVAFPLLSLAAMAVFFVLVLGSGDAIKPAPDVIVVTVVWIPFLFAFGILTRDAQGHGRMTLFNSARLISGVGAPIGIACLAIVAALAATPEPGPKTRTALVAIFRVNCGNSWQNHLTANY